MKKKQMNIISLTKKICQLKLQEKTEEQKFYELMCGESNEENIFQYMSSEDFEKFQEILDEIYSTYNIKTNYKYDEINDFLENILRKSFKYEGNEKEDYVKKALKRFNKQVSKEIQQKWTFFIPITNLEIKEKINIANFEMGTIDDFSLDIKSEFEKRNDLENFDRCIELYKNDILVKVELNGRKSQIILDAYNQVEILLGILNFFNRKYTPAQIKGESKNKSYERILYFSDDNLMNKFQLNDKRDKKVLNEKIIKKFRLCGLEEIELILNNDSKTKVEYRILDSLFFYYKSSIEDIEYLEDYIQNKEESTLNLKYYKSSIKCVLLFIALESLLVTKTDGVIEQLTHRVSLIMFKNQEKGEDFRKSFKHLYSERGDFVHFGKNYISIKSMDALEKIFRRCLFTILFSIKFKNLSTEKSLDMFFNELEENPNYFKDLKEFLSD